MYAVVINEGPAMADDNAVYFSKEKPVYLLVEFTDSLGENVKYARFVSFYPTNGRSKGKLTSFPLERVVSVTDEAQDG